MEEKDLVVDNVNLSAFAPPEAAYTVGYVFVDGTQGGTMLSGGMTVDELKVREQVTYPLLPLTDDQISTVLALVLNNPVHTVHYYSPWKGERTIRMRREIGTLKQRGRGADGNSYWTGAALIFTEKD